MRNTEKLTEVICQNCGYTITEINKQAINKKCIEDLNRFTNCCGSANFMFKEHMNPNLIKSWSHMSKDIRSIITEDQKILENTNFSNFQNILANDITRYIFNRFDINKVFDKGDK